MHIFIDEAGIFRNPDRRGNVPSCVGALTIPSTRKKEVFKAFDALKYQWGKAGREVKGSKLDEFQVDAVVQMLKKHDVLLEITAIDMEQHTDETIEEYKTAHAESITLNITDQHQPHVRQQAAEIRASFEKMSTQLFIQAFLMMSLIERTMLHGILYYARRIPEELQWFYWVIDAKQENLTDFEKAWTLLAYVTMSTNSLNQPVAFFEGGDYSHFDKFYREQDPEKADYFREQGLDPDEVVNINIGKVLGDHRTFQGSQTNLGLQIIDILVTATRRALKGTLSRPGWNDIGSLMLNKRSDGSLNGINAVRLNLSELREGKTSFPIQSSLGVYKVFLNKAKSILRPDEMR